MLVSNTDMKIASNKDINKVHKKLSVIPPDASKKVIPAVQHNNLKMLNEKHSDEKLVITLLIAVVGLIAYHFLVENVIIIIHSCWCRDEHISL